MRKIFFIVIALLLADVVSAQNQPPPCQGNSVLLWTNCFGRWLNLNGDKYEGEWRNGKPHGQGIKTFQSGEKYTGAWSEGKFEGFGTLTSLNGSIISQGAWLANNISALPIPAISKANDAQRIQNERKAAQVEAERIRVAKELESAKQAVPLSIRATASLPVAGAVIAQVLKHQDVGGLIVGRRHCSWTLRVRRLDRLRASSLSYWRAGGRGSGCGSA